MRYKEQASRQRCESSLHQSQRYVPRSLSWSPLAVVRSQILHTRPDTRLRNPRARTRAVACENSVLVNISSRACFRGTCGARVLAPFYRE